MQIEYEIKYTDFLRFNVVHQFLSAKLQILFLLLCVFIFFTSPASAGISHAARSAFNWYVVLWLLQVLLNAIYLYSKNNRSVVAKHRIELQEGALLEETKFNKSYHFWPGVVRAVARPGFIAIYTSSLHAHVIPNRAFATASERADFLALAKKKIAEAAGSV